MSKFSFTLAICVFLVVLLEVNGSCSEAYNSKKGDSCELIAALHGVRLADLKTWNPKVDCRDGNKLKTGTIVCVKGSHVTRDYSTEEVETTEKPIIDKLFSAVKQGSDNEEDSQSIGSAFAEIEE